MEKALFRGGVSHHHQNPELAPATTEVTPKVNLSFPIVHPIPLAHSLGNPLGILKDLFRGLEKVEGMEEEKIGGRVRFFQQNWARITQDPNILDCIKGLKLPLLEVPSQGKEPNPLVFSDHKKGL